MLLTERLCYFNPRSRERSDRILLFSLHIRHISIHAPARGATLLTNSKQPRIEISIHAPARGATMPDTMPTAIASNFNPRSRERSDRGRIMSNYEYLGFQSTLPREERLRLACFLLTFFLFQSTLPREERQQYCTKNLFIFIQYRQ